MRSWLKRLLRWHLVAAVIGTAAMTASVVFFGLTSDRDDQLLDDGTLAPGVVVGTHPAGWNPLSSGRLVVKFPVGGRELTREIWLDEPSHTQRAGTPVIVVYDPHDLSRVRTLTDANDPAGLGLLFFTVGVAGFLAVAAAGVLAIGTRLLARSRRRANAEPEPFSGAALPAVTPVVPADGGSAWDDPQTRRQCERYRTGIGLFALAAVVMSFVAAVIFVTVTSADDRLLRHGVRTTGTVVHGGGYGGRRTQGYVEVEYYAAGVRERHRLHGPSPDDLAVGTPVDVIYDRRDPSHFRTPDYANHGNIADNLLKLPPAFAGMLFLSGAIAAFRLRRARRLLRSGPWEQWAAVAFVMPPRNNPLVALIGKTADAGEVRVDLKFGSTMSFAVRRLDLDPGATVYLRMSAGRRGFLSAPSALRPFEVLLPRTPRQEKRWRRQLDREVGADERRRRGRG